jgi:hypothetical protein
MAPRNYHGEVLNEEEPPAKPICKFSHRGGPDNARLYWRTAKEGPDGSRALYSREVETFYREMLSSNDPAIMEEKLTQAINGFREASGPPESTVLIPELPPKDKNNWFLRLFGSKTTS